MNDSLDLLAEFMGVGEVVAEVTNRVSSNFAAGQCSAQPLLAAVAV